MGGREEGGEKRREEERWEHSVQFVGSCYERTVLTSHSNASKLDAVFVDQCLVLCLLA